MNAGFLVKFALVTTILLAWIFLKEKMTVTKAISASIMILGGYLLSTKGQSLIPQVGDVLIVLACLAWSIGNILVRKAIKDSNISGDIVSFLRPIASIPVFLFFILLSPFYPPQIRNVFTADYLNFSFFPYVLGSGIFTALFMDIS